jgi:hypothetical protein
VTEASSERRDVQEKLDGHYRRLVDIIAGRAEAELRAPPAPGEWSALQQVEHQLLTENVWTDMIALTCREDEPDLAQLWAQYRRLEEANPFPPPAEPRPLADLLAAFEARHDQTMRLLEATPDAAFARKGRNTGFGNLNVLQMFRAIYRHCSMHIDQIEGREPSFQPRRVS